MKVAYWADGPHRRAGAGGGVHAAPERRVGARRDRAPRAARRRRPTSCSRSCARRSVSAARCCAARSPASSTAERSPPPASPRRRAPRSSASTTGCRLATDRGVGVIELLRAGQADADAAHHRRARRRLPPARRRDGEPRPRRRADDRPRPATAITVERPVSPTACRPTTATSCAGRSALVGRTADVHVDKRIPHGGGLGGGSADAAAVLRWAGFDDLAGRRGLGADVPFCLVGGRARVTRHRRDRRAARHPSRSDGHAGRAAAARQHAGRLPGVGRARRTDRRRAATTSSRRPSSSSRRSAAWRDRIGELAGVTPVLAGSGRRGSCRASATTPSRPLRSRGRCGRGGPRCTRGRQARCGSVTAVATTCDAGGGCAGASSCASSCASACGAS